MKRLPSLAAAVGSIALTGLFAFAPTASEPTSSAATTPSPAPASAAAIEKKTLPIDAFKLGGLTGADLPAPQPTWSPPAGYNGALQPEDWVQISGTDSCLNVRVAPGLTWHYPENDQPVPTLNCLADGYAGQLSFGPYNSDPANAGMPVQADGYWWWNLLGQGWVAEDWLTAAAAPVGAARAELADAGLIAFVRQDGVWLMGADGSSPRLLYAADQQTTTISSIAWAPDGSGLAISTYAWSGPEGLYLTSLVSLDGTVTRELPGLSEATWSPDGTKISALRHSQPEANQGQTTPVVLDLTSGNEAVLGLRNWYFRGPAWAPDGSSLALFCRSSKWDDYSTVPPTHREIECGGDGLRAISADGSGGRVIAELDGQGISWSPDGRSIATYSFGGSCNGYAILDAASGGVTTCLDVPQQVSFGGCGIGIELGASDWTPDGRTLAYHWQSGAGQNGVALVDIATGERLMIPTTGASSISFSGDGAHLSYESAGYVWTADSDGTHVTRVTDGWLPAWQPLP